jgi:hypothetical protein
MTLDKEKFLSFLDRQDRIPPTFDANGNALPIRIRAHLERWDEDLGVAEFMPMMVTAIARLHYAVALRVDGEWIYGGLMDTKGEVITDEDDFNFAFDAMRHAWLAANGM